MPLTLAEARTLAAAASRRAGADGIRVTVAVVDEGGGLLLLERMDGAMPLSAEIAEAKAVGAALLHRDGEALAELHQARPAFFAQVDRMVRTPLIPGLGSLVLRRAGAVVGAVGVSGGRPEQDLDCARAGAEALEAAT